MWSGSSASPPGLARYSYSHWQVTFVFQKEFSDTDKSTPSYPSLLHSPMSVSPPAPPPPFMS